MSEDIQELRIQLQVFRTSFANFEDTLRRLKIGDGRTNTPATTDSPVVDEDNSVRDRNGNIISIGCNVQFLTRGRFKSTRGKVYKIFSNKERVTARDAIGRSISRAPNNLRVLLA